MNPQDIIITFIAGTAVFFILGSFGIVFTLIHKKKQLANRQERQLIENNYQQELLRSRVEIQEEILKHISRELHDNFGHITSLIKINLNTLKLSEPQKALEKIESSKELCRHLMADIKSLSVSLNSDRVAQAGFYRSLETEVERLSKAGQLTIRFSMNEPLPALQEDHALILFRMTQEIFQNVLKHSQAGKMDCIVFFSENTLYLNISDDGVGFDPAKKNGSGSGMQNLISRAAMINAMVAIESRENSGTTVKIRLPM